MCRTAAGHTARAPDDLTLELATDLPALRIATGTVTPSENTDQLSIAQRVEQALGAATKPINLRELRALCRMRTETLCTALDVQVADGRVIKSADGYALNRT